EKGTKLLREIQQDRARLEHANGLRAAAVQQRRDLGVWVDRHETAAELIALADVDQPGIVLSPRVTQGQQLLEQDRDLHAIGRTERVELQGVAADRELPLMRCACDRSVDVRKGATAGLGRAPYLRWRVFRGIRHDRLLSLEASGYGGIVRWEERA